MSDTSTGTQPSTATSRKGTVVLTVLLTLACVFIFEKLVVLMPPRSYRERMRREEALLSARERRDHLYEEGLQRDIEHQKQWYDLLIQQQTDNNRYQKILDTWEQQQKAYQAYLDSLKKPQ